MVNKTSHLLKDIGANVQLLRDTSNTPSEDTMSSEDVFVFFSLDLTNSTRFKNEQPQLWPMVISAFYDVVFEQYGVDNYQPKNAKISTGGVQFWKFIGDEVLLYTKVYEYKDVYTFVQATDECIKKIPQLIDQKLKSKECREEECDGERKGKPCEYYRKQDIGCRRKEIICNSLGVKATLWMALCGDSPSNSRNIIHITETVTGFGEDEKKDFLGPEIDEGFRISKYAVKNRVIVSPFLANVLYCCGDKEDDFKMIVQNNFKIISFQQLKGVWNERPVPIIMYSSHFSEFYELAEYDELELPVYENIRQSGLEKFLIDPRYDIKRLKKVLEEVHLDQEATALIKRIVDPEYVQQSSIKAKCINNELHVACACFSTENKLLIMNHSTRGWEFGCTHILKPSDWKQAIQKGYQEKYRLNINVDENPIPVATYTYEKQENGKEKTALGLIVLAEVDSVVEGDFQFISEDEIDSLTGKMVDSFQDNARRAFQLYRK